jgi:hypothetical protein
MVLARGIVADLGHVLVSLSQAPSVDLEALTGQLEAMHQQVDEQVRHQRLYLGKQA